MNRSAMDGFTLLEMVISLTIFSMVIVTVYATINIGADAAVRGTNRSIENQRARAALALMTRQLKSAYPLTLQADGETFVYFFGSSTELTFISGNGRAETGGLTKISYFLREEDNITSLWVRTATPTLPADLVEEREGSLVQEALVLPDVEELVWEYFGQTGTQEEWTDEWDGKEEPSLPLAIRCSWRARLGELPDEWQFEVPIYVPELPRELRASPQSGSRDRRRRRREE